MDHGLFFLLFFFVFTVNPHAPCTMMDGGLVASRFIVSSR